MGRNPWKDAAVITAVSGITTLNLYLSGAITIAIPTIGEDLNMTQSQMQWPVTVYSLSYGCLLLFFAKLGDIYGPKIMFFLGSLWFGAWSIAAPFSPSAPMFIVIIAMKGVGAAANTPAALGLLVEYFPPGPDRNRALGILGAFQPIGWIIGLIVGGILAGSPLTWKGIFYVQAGMAFVFAILGYSVFATSSMTTNKRYTKGLDWGGAILSTGGIGLLTYALADSTDSPKGWASPHIPAMFASSLILIAAFIYYEHVREKRNLSVLMPLSIWTAKKPRLPALMLMVFFGWWSFNALIYWFTLFFQQVQHLDPIQASLRFIPMVVSGITVNIIGAWLMSRVRGDYLMIGGLLGNVAAPLLYSLIDVDGSYWSMAFVALVLIAGTDIAYPAALLHLSNSFDDDSQSLAGGVFNVGTRLGTSLGVAISASIATQLTKQHPAPPYTTEDSLMIGFRAAGWSCVAAGSISVIVVAVGLRGIGIVGLNSLDKDDQPTNISTGTLDVERTMVGEISTSTVNFKKQ